MTDAFGPNAQPIQNFGGSSPGMNLKALFGTGLTVGALSAGAAYLTGRSQSKEIKRVAEENFARVADFVTQARVDKILQTEQLAREARVKLGAVLNVSPQGLSARETIASRIVAGVATDQFTINTELKRRETAAKAEMSNIASGANSALAGVSANTGAAFGQGMNAGMNLYQQYSAMKNAEAQLPMQQAIYRQQDEYNAVQSEGLNDALDATRDENRFLLGKYNEQYASNKYVASSAGVQVGFRQIFGPSMGFLPSLKYAYGGS